MKQNRSIILALACAAATPLAPGQGIEDPIDPTPGAGPYSMPHHDPTNAFDAPIPGFVGPHGRGKPRIDQGWGDFDNEANYVNPLFFAWADHVENFECSDPQTPPHWLDSSLALGPVTGDHFDIVSLGDMSAQQIAAGEKPGTITLRLAKPVMNRSGADFTVFENGFVSNHSTGGGSVRGAFWAELAYVEVSANGVDFVRFPSASLTPASVGPYGTVDASNVFNLAGKHANAYGLCWGTPFDLSAVGLSRITHVRIVDIPGNGSFLDSSNRPIYDAWFTWGSGGADIEAVGAISVDMTYDEWPCLEKLDPSQRGKDADPDGDGISNLLEYAFGLVPWEKDERGTAWKHAIIEESGDHFFELTTQRDERLIDLKREIQVSEDLSSWETLAVSVAGAPFQAANGHAVSIVDQSASDIVSVGVIRRDRIRDLVPLATQRKRFYRLSITCDPP